MSNKIRYKLVEERLYLTIDPYERRVTGYADFIILPLSDKIKTLFLQTHPVN